MRSEFVVIENNWLLYRRDTGVPVARNELNFELMTMADVARESRARISRVLTGGTSQDVFRTDRDVSASKHARSMRGT